MKDQLENWTNDHRNVETTRQHLFEILAPSILHRKKYSKSWSIRIRKTKLNDTLSLSMLLK